MAQATSKSNQSPKYGYQSIFVMLVVFLVVTAFCYEYHWVHLVANILFTAIFLLAVYSLSNRRIYFIITLVLALTTAATSWVYLTTGSSMALYLDVGTNIVFFAYLVILFSGKVFRHREITSDTIFGALCIYFLLAMFWTFVFYLMDLLNPAAFDLGSRTEDITSYVYYSFVTLTTLGYGDITPHTPPAKILAALEAVFGQLFLAVVVARFVGIYASRKSSKAD